MKAVVVYESLWGNTAAVARAIAEGIGDGAQALSTAEATAEAVAGSDLIVAGSPLLGFSLPNDQMIDTIRTSPRSEPNPPDLSQPSMRAWLDGLARGSGRGAGFETRIWWSPGSAAKAIAKRLERAGFAPAGKPAKFVVTGRTGPLKDGELERARAWGVELARNAVS
jgi:hypothetical protein